MIVRLLPLSPPLDGIYLLVGVEGQEDCMRDVGRGQSETVGVVLLVGVAVILSVTIGSFLLGNFDDSGESQPIVEVRTGIADQNVTITHFGGRSYDASDIRVLVRQQGNETLSYHLDSEFTPTNGGDAATFEAGDRWEKQFDTGSYPQLSGEVELLVFDDRENELLHDESYVISA